ncbi:hypothetical protein [Oenococcus phage Vinitor-27]|nr:hypothetical protein [Oenococcus phage Vinitor-27]
MTPILYTQPINILTNGVGPFQPNRSTIPSGTYDNYVIYTGSTVNLVQGQTYTISGSTNGTFSSTHNPAVESDNVVLWIDTPTQSVVQIVSSATTGTTGTTFTWTHATGSYCLRVNVYHVPSVNTIYAENIQITNGSNLANYSDAGIGFLQDALTCTVDEQRNGDFTLSMTYPVDGIHASDLVINNAIKVNVGTILLGQIFIIKTVTTEVDTGIITVYAEHIRYLINDLIMKPTGSVTGTAQVALNYWLTQLVENSDLFTVTSDITTSETVTIGSPDFTTAQLALGGQDGSILDTYDGEYKFDNLNISLLKQRGKSSGATITYGKNLTTATQENDITNTVTSIVPYATITTEDSNGNDVNTVHWLTPMYIDSEYASNFPHRVFELVDFSSSFQQSSDDTTLPAYSDTEMTTLATQYMKDNSWGEPTVSITVNTIDLARSLNGGNSDNIELCDWVNVYFENIGIQTTAECSEAVWDVLAEQYTSYTFGALTTTLGDQITQVASDTSDAVGALVQQVQKVTDSAGHTDYTIESSEAMPTEANPGDTLFVEDGSDIVIYTWATGTDGNYTWVKKVGTDNAAASAAASLASSQAAVATQSASAAAASAAAAENNASLAQISAASAYASAVAASTVANSASEAASTANSNVTLAQSSASTANSNVALAQSSASAAVKSAASAYGSAQTAWSNASAALSSANALQSSLANMSSAVSSYATSAGVAVSNAIQSAENYTDDTKANIEAQYSSVNKVVNTEFDIHDAEKEVTTPAVSMPTPNTNGYPDQNIINNLVANSSFNPDAGNWDVITQNGATGTTITGAHSVTDWNGDGVDIVEITNTNGSGQYRIMSKPIPLTELDLTKPISIGFRYYPFTFGTSGSFFHQVEYLNAAGEEIGHTGIGSFTTGSGWNNFQQNAITLAPVTGTVSIALLFDVRGSGTHVGIAAPYLVNASNGTPYMTSNYDGSSITIHDPADGTYEISGKATIPYTNYVSSPLNEVSLNDTTAVTKLYSLSTALTIGNTYAIRADFVYEPTASTYGTLSLIMTGATNQTVASGIALDPTQKNHLYYVFTATAANTAISAQVTNTTDNLVFSAPALIDSRLIEVEDSTSKVVGSEDLGDKYNSDKIVEDDLSAISTVQHDNDNSTNQLSGASAMNETTVQVKDPSGNTVQKFTHIGTKNLITDSEILLGFQTSSANGWNNGNSNSSIVSGAYTDSNSKTHNAIQISQSSATSSVVVSQDIDIEIGQTYYWQCYVRVVSGVTIGTGTMDIHMDGRTSAGVSSENSANTSVNTGVAYAWKLYTGVYTPTNSSTDVLRLRLENLTTGTVQFTQPIVTQSVSLPYFADTVDKTPFTYTLPSDGKTYTQTVSSQYLIDHHNNVENSDILNNGVSWSAVDFDNWNVLSEPDEQYYGSNIWEFNSSTAVIDHIRSVATTQNLILNGWYTAAFTYKFLSDVATSSSGYYHMTISFWNSNHVRILYSDVNLSITNDWTTQYVRIQVPTGAYSISLELGVSGTGHIYMTHPLLYATNDDFTDIIYEPDSNPVVSTTKITTFTQIDRSSFDFTIPANSGNDTLIAGAQGNYPFTVAQNLWPIAFNGITIDESGNFIGTGYPAGAQIFASNATSNDTYSCYADSNGNFVLAVSTFGEVLQFNYEYYEAISVITNWKDNVDNNFDAQKATVASELYNNSKVLEIEGASQTVNLDAQEIAVFAGQVVSAQVTAKIVSGTGVPQLQILCMDSSDNQLEVLKAVNITGSTFANFVANDLTTIANTANVKFRIYVPSGTVVRISQPILVFLSAVAGYTVGTGVNASAILGLFSDSFALGLFDNSGAIITGINGTSSAMKITGKNIYLNGDTTVTGGFWADNIDAVQVNANTGIFGQIQTENLTAATIDVDQLTGNISNFITSYWEDPYKNSITVNGSQIVLSNPNNDSEMTLNANGVYLKTGGLQISPKTGGRYGIYVTKWGDYNGTLTSSLGAYIGTNNDNQDGFIAFTGNGLGTTLLWADTNMVSGAQQVMGGAWNFYQEILMSSATRIYFYNGNNYIYGGSTGLYLSGLSYVYSNHAITVSSKLSKKNIHGDYQLNALDEIIKTIPSIKLFNYKTDPDGTPETLSPIIDDVHKKSEFYIPKIIDNGEGIDTYSMISLAYLGIGKLNEKQNSLEKRINTLELAIGDKK